MIYIRGVMLHPSMARLATVENLCNILPTWFIQKPKARARCGGLIAVCPESLWQSVPNPSVCPESLCPESLASRQAGSGTHKATLVE